MAKQWPGFTERLQQSIREAGYRNAAQFADAKGIRITYVYKWLGGTTPDRENLERLATHLGVSPAWLLFGDDVEKAVRPIVLRALAWLVVALGVTAASGVRSSEAGYLGPTVGEGPAESAYYVNLWRRFVYWWWSRQTDTTITNPASCKTFLQLTCYAR
jgi:transcriptional regulator with XRE-family HTH domain